MFNESALRLMRTDMIYNSFELFPSHGIEQLHDHFSSKCLLTNVVYNYIQIITFVFIFAIIIVPHLTITNLRHGSMIMIVSAFL